MRFMVLPNVFGISDYILVVGYGSNGHTMKICCAKHYRYAERA